MDWVWRVWGYKDPTAANAADDDFEIIQSDTADTPVGLAQSSLIVGDPLEARPPKAKHVVFLTIGSRGDVQPFIAFGRHLLQFGHTVTIATHAEYRQWVEENGIGFRPISGDPAALMQLCIQNGMFTVSFIREAFQRFDTFITGLLESSWAACRDADVLVATPSALCGIHIAERLEVPFCYAMPFPWTQTTAFPHPMASPHQYAAQLLTRYANAVTQGNVNAKSYALIDALLWYALADKFNHWRKTSLGLPPCAGPPDHRAVPMIYPISTALLPKPQDWGEHIHMPGFWFADDPSATWDAPPRLAAFLARRGPSAPPLVYIGFGSIVVDDPDAFQDLLVSAVRSAGVRAVIARGWSRRRVGSADATPGPAADSASLAASREGGSEVLGDAALERALKDFLIDEEEDGFVVASLATDERRQGADEAGESRIDSHVDSHIDSLIGGHIGGHGDTHGHGHGDSGVAWRGEVADETLAEPAASPVADHPPASDDAKDTDSGDIIFIDAAPHAWLFGRVDAVVHHGGIGTTAAGLRAGRPTAIAPFFGDQYFWAQRVVKLGVGVALNHLDAESLQVALTAITTDRGMKERAEEMGRRIAKENGLKDARLALYHEINRVRHKQLPSVLSTDIDNSTVYLGPLPKSDA